MLRPGIPDKNGVLIFEGDILMYRDTKVQCIYSEGCCRYELKFLEPVNGYNKRYIPMSIHIAKEITHVEE